MKTCPYCAEENRDGAVVCDNCGHAFATEERQQASTSWLESRRQASTAWLKSRRQASTAWLKSTQQASTAWLKSTRQTSTAWLKSTRQTSTAWLQGKTSKRLVVPLLALAVVIAGALFPLLHAKNRNNQASGTVSQSGAPSGGRSRPPHIILIASASAIEIEPGTVQRFDWTVPADQPNCHLTGHIEVTSGGPEHVQVLVATAGDYKNLTTGHSAAAYLKSDTATIVNLDIRLNTPSQMVLAIGDTASAAAGKRVKLSDVKATCT